MPDAWCRADEGRGWHEPREGRVAHYLDRGTSLCGRWTVDGHVWLEADEARRWGRGDCQRCTKLRVAQRVVESAFVDAVLEELRRTRLEVEARGRLLDSYEARLAAYRSRALAVSPGVEREPPLWWGASAGAWAELVPVSWGWDREPEPDPDEQYALELAMGCR